MPPPCFHPGGQYVDTEELDQVVLAHYTVKEFIYADRTALKSTSHVSRFALQEQTVIRQWADLVFRTALSAPASDRVISEKTIGDYCSAVGCSIIKTWEEMLVEDDLADACFDFLDPAGAHHSRNSAVIADIDWFSAPTNPRVAALAECYAKGWSLLAGAALRSYRCPTNH